MTNADLAQQFLQSGEGVVMAGDDATIDLVSAIVSALLAVADSIDRLADAQAGPRPVPSANHKEKPKLKSKGTKPRR